MAATVIEAPATPKEKVRDWTKPAAMAIPKEGYVSLKREIRPDISTNSGLPWIHHNREDQVGKRGHDPRLRQDHRESDCRYTRCT